MKEKSNVRPLLFFFLFIFLIGLTPIRGSAQNNLISLSVENINLKQLFDEIEKQSAYRFSDRDELLNNNNDILLNVSEQPLESFLISVLSTKGLQHRTEGSTVHITSSASEVKKSVTGTVIDIHGDAIVGANVVVKGTTNGTVTDIEGNFNIQVPKKIFFKSPI